MKKKFKKGIAVLLIVMISLSIVTPAFAMSEGDIDSTQGVLSRLDYESVQMLKEKYNLTPCDEETMRQILYEIENLSKNAIDNEDKLSRNISNDESLLDSLPVVKLSATDVNQLFKNDNILLYSAPVAPEPLNGVDFYAMNTSYTISGTKYDVVQIVAYSTNMNSPLATSKSFELINSASYSVSQLNKVISAVCGIASNFENLAMLSLGSYIADLANYCGSSSAQELTVVANTTQIMCYAYVNKGTLPYDLMLTTQRINIEDNYIFKAMKNGTIQTNKSFIIDGYADSDYYSNFRHAAEHYASNPATGEEYYVGTSVKYYYDGILKNQLSVNVYPSPASIPPGFSV